MTPQNDFATWLKLLPILNESQLRWYAAEKAIELGHGGSERVHQLTGLSLPTIRKGIRELCSEQALSLDSGIRRGGAGRKSREQEAPRLCHDLEGLLEESIAGNPMSPLIWTSKSTRTLAAELGKLGHRVSHETVNRLLSDLDYTQQGNRKNKEGMHSPERDEQFQHINAEVKAFIDAGDPVLSIDCKKKEHVGEFKNPGKSWRKKGQPRDVHVYDFPSLSQGEAIPYGIYDVQRNDGMVNLGISHETAEFAVASIRYWWRSVGARRYSETKQILLCADGGGSNGSRNRLWKLNLQQFADETGLAITVCHYPPGTSKWNKIEHRMFSFISISWRGEPLVSYETIIKLIGHTKTVKGLRVRAHLDKSTYETGKTVTASQMKKVNVQHSATLPMWNYTISPTGKVIPKQDLCGQTETLLFDVP